MDNSSFYMTLPSNVRNTHFNNTVANFKTDLAQKLFLSDEWEVGLAGISYTNSWYNLISEQTVIVVFYDSSTTPSLPRNANFLLPKGKYKKIDDLLRALEYQFGVFKKNFEKKFDVPVFAEGKAKPIFNFHATENKVSITLPKFDGRSVYFNFSNELSTILGFKKENLDEKIGKVMIAYSADTKNSTKLPRGKFETITGDEPFTLDHIYYGLYVYCDIIRPAFVGDTLTHLLRYVEIPPNSSYGDQIVLSYPDTHYIPLLIKEIKTIEIDIKDEYGNSFPFEYGRSIVILHFRKKQ